MYNSYFGTILEVDLTTKTTKTYQLNKSWIYEYIGGSGLGARMLYELFSTAHVPDPLSGANPLLFITSPLTGTKAPCSGRYEICARSPLTTIWGESSAGGWFGPELRRTGFDGILIRGCANKFVYLLIRDRSVEFKNAEHLVGMDTYETQAVIKRDESDDKLRIACIGIAGENLVKFACVINDEGRAAGRCGLGAVMGAKRLKAVGVHGTHEIRVANEREFTTVAREAFETVRESFIGTMFNQLGTSGYVDVGQIYGDMPNKYFQAGTSPGYDKLSGATMKETILIGRVHCYRCPIGCGRKIEIKKGKYKLPPTEGPEYETVAALGTLLNINDLSAVSYANWLCNRYGIDTISCGVTIAFAYWLYERNKLSTIFEESGGQKYREKLKLTWGNAEPMHELIELIARREGIGNLLADGAYMLGEKVGMSAYAAAVKRLEIPMHDPRAFIGQAVCYATAPRGACHLQGDMYQVDMAMAIPELDIHTTDRLVYTEAKIDNIIRIQNYRTLFNALCICQFAAVTPSQIALLLTHALGKQYEVRHLNEVGERIFTLKRMLNLQFGMRPQDDTLPQIVLESLREGGTEGKVPPLAQMLQDYYKHRKWDRNSGMPAKTKLRELNLEFTLNDSEST